MRQLTFLGIALGLMLALPLATPASADVIFSDNFDDDAGDLLGETAVSGQTWGDKEWTTRQLQAGTAYGQGGTNGVGRTASADNAVNLGTTITSGEYTFAADMARASGNDLTAMVRQSPGSVGFTWQNDGDLVGEGVYHGRTVNAGMSTGNLHIDLIFDLEAESGSVSWYDIDDPTDITTSGTADWAFNTTYDPPWAFTKIHLYNAGAVGGFDNVSLAIVPEPSVLLMALFGFVGLIAIRRIQRR